jgi:hypothetical protein
MRRIHLIVSAISVIIATASPAAARPSSGAVDVDRYLHAYYHLLRTASNNLPAGRAAEARLMQALEHRCPNVLSGAPMDARTAVLGTEVLGALSVANFGPEGAAGHEFALAVKHLAFGDAHVRRAVRAYASQVEGYTDLMSPSLCLDAEAYRATGFSVLPSRSQSFVKDFEALENEPSDVPSTLLIPYEQPKERPLLRATRHLESRIGAAELAVLTAWKRTLEVLGYPSHAT